MQGRLAQLASLLQSCIAKPYPLAGRAVHAQIIAAGLAADTFLSNRLIELYSRCRLFHPAITVFRCVPCPNSFSWNAALSAASKSGDLLLARNLFDEMPERNVVSWNTMISSLVRGGCQGDALGLCCLMVQQGFLPTNFTFASVLSACGAVGDLIFGRVCHGLAVKIGLQGNLFVDNALVGMYTKCWSTDDAVKVFDGMTEPNEVSFTSLIGGLVQCGSAEEAVELFARMHRRGVCIDQVAVSCVLGACARAEEEFNGLISLGVVAGQSIQALVVKCGFLSDPHVGNSLIDMYVKFGNMDDAQRVFNALPCIDNVSWNVLIAGYGQRGDAGKAKDILEMMRLAGFEPDDVTYISLLASCAMSGDVVSACQMFNKIEAPSVTSWNAILSCYCQDQKFSETVNLFREMQFKYVLPDRSTLAIVLSSCSGLGLLEFGKQVHAASVRTILYLDMFVASGLVDMYSKCGSIEVARLIFDGMVERDVVSWNSMITGFAHHSLNKEAFAVFKQMCQNGICPTESSYASVLNSCARLSSLPQGRQVHAQLTKDGYDSYVYAGSALIDMYARCGDVDQARCFFDNMRTKNVVSWNEMIHGYAQNGCGVKSVDLFKDMVLCKEVKPDSVTFIAVLTACSHSGMVEEGMKILDAMEKDYGIKPVSDHYTCVIDSLGRAGRFAEAEVIVEKMSCKTDPILWEVLLSACAVHGNASLGKFAAEKLFQLDPLNSSPYVLLSNIYTSLGRRKDASVVRTMMSEKGIAKARGYSWIDNEKGVRAFMVDDIYELAEYEDKPATYLVGAAVAGS